MELEDLSAWIHDARERTLALVEDLADALLMGPQLAIVNPLLWEIAHVAWFQERWVLRHARGEPALDAASDALYDSSAVPHDTRWSLPLYSRDRALAFLHEVRRRVLSPLGRGPTSDSERYFLLLSVLHEDMHDEAFLYTRQTLGYPPPRGIGQRPPALAHGGSWPGDAHIPGGTFLLGAAPGGGFVFDNEKWQHEVHVEPFAMARAPVTQAEFAAFVDDGGYNRQALWSDEGWRWRERAEAACPAYWQRAPAGWQRRRFDQMESLAPHQPMIHVNWHEAQAYCRWALRRLPTESEWEVAASATPGRAGGLSMHKRLFPWGDEPATDGRANLGMRRLGPVDVAHYPQSDSAFGCRQMAGNVWEWTASDFLPYPGFVVDPYQDYSQPWFGSHKVLRGGCFATQARLLRNTWRNFYTPDRRDVWAGFRTCAIA